MPASYTLVTSFCVGCLLFLGIFSKVRPKTWEEDEFLFYIDKYNKSYANDTEYNQRFLAFKKSIEMIDVMNKQRNSQTSALYGITRYSDMLEDEFLEAHLQKNYAERIALRQQTDIQNGNKSKKRRFRDIHNIANLPNLPRKMDWREHGVVTPVNNQRDCGACWAFSAMETIEAQAARLAGVLRPLSTQQMIDCARNGNNGCRGGDICTLLEWLADGDIPIRTASEYPLHLKNEACQVALNCVNCVRVESYACMTMVGQEDDLLLGLARMGPVAVAVNAISWQNYLGGVIQHHCGAHPTLMNHAVQIVGYDLDAEIPHYIVRNSWGEDFGHEGYLMIAIGGNLCGIVNEVATVEVRVDGN